MGRIKLGARGGSDAGNDGGSWNRYDTSLAGVALLGRGARHLAYFLRDGHLGEAFSSPASASYSRASQLERNRGTSMQSIAMYCAGS